MLGEDVFVEPDDERLAGAQSRCAKVSGWTQHGVDRFRCPGPAGELRDLLALGDDDLLRGLRESEGIVPSLSLIHI